MERVDKVFEAQGTLLIIKSRNTSVNAITNEPIWAGSGTYGVNKITRENVAGYGDTDRTGYFLFPLHVEKKDYIFWAPMTTEGATLLKFEAVELVNGLETYKFTHDLEPIDKTVFFPWLQGFVVKGDHKGTQWVEPTTGHVVKFEHSGLNKLFDQSTLKEIQDFQIWSRKTTHDVITNQVRIAQNAKQTIILYENWVPILLGMIAVAILAAFIASRKLISQP